TRYRSGTWPSNSAVSSSPDGAMIIGELSTAPRKLVVSGEDEALACGELWRVEGQPSPRVGRDTRPPPIPRLDEPRGDPDSAAAISRRGWGRSRGARAAWGRACPPPPKLPATMRCGSPLTTNLRRAVLSAWISWRLCEKLTG